MTVELDTDRAAGNQALDSLSVELAQVVEALATVRRLVHAGRFPDAPQVRRLVASALAACGMATRELQQLTTVQPGHPAETGGPGAAGLTLRERQVATLVCDGLTNRQIASRMFITEKTVEMYLSRVFRKLHVSNRVALVRALWNVGG